MIQAHLVHLDCTEVNTVRRTYLSDAGKANKALQDSLDRNESGIVASYALIGAILLLGGVGMRSTGGEALRHGFCWSA